MLRTVKKLLVIIILIIIIVIIIIMIIIIIIIIINNNINNNNNNNKPDILLMDKIKRKVHLILEYWKKRMKKYQTTNRGGARNFPTEGLELPIGGLKRQKMVFLCAILLKFLRREPKFPPTGGCSPPSPPLVPQLTTKTQSGS